MAQLFATVKAYAPNLAQFSSPIVGGVTSQEKKSSFGSLNVEKTQDRGSMLPMVKCSSCGNPVEMAALATHVCSPTQAAPPSAPAPAPVRRLRPRASTLASSIPPQVPLPQSSPPPPPPISRARTPQPTPMSRRQSPAPPPAPPPLVGLPRTPRQSNQLSPVSPSRTGTPLSVRSNSTVRARPSFEGSPRPSFDSSRSAPDRRRLDVPVPPRAYSESGRRPSIASRPSISSPRPSISSSRPFVSSRPSTDSRRPSTDTRPSFDGRPAQPPPDPEPTNGGMAGVGRKAFLAAARAALLTTPASHPQQQSFTPPFPSRTPPMPSRTPPKQVPTPPLLTSTPSYLSAEVPTPPLSPGSSSPRTLTHPRTPSPPPPVPSPSKKQHPFPVRKDSRGVLNRRLSRKFSRDEVEDRPRPSMDSESSIGLAYDAPSEASPPPSPPPEPERSLLHASPEKKNAVAFPSSRSSTSSYTTSGDKPGLARSESSVSAYSHSPSLLRQPAHSTPTTSALGRLAALAEEPPVPKMPSRSQTINNPPGLKREKSSAQLKAKRCAKCRVDLAGRRWVRTDEGSGLCEACWKDMYLPKCRRCNESISKSCVSSSDGALKGKYHPECFSCEVCEKSFPDRSFYVHEGSPYCAYHYAEANNSLCTDFECGEPIEGACAVVDALGEDKELRFHPRCFTCQAASCREVLDGVYFEVDGRRLCSKHAKSSFRRGGGGGAGGFGAGMDGRRVTRFVDLGEAMVH